MSVKSSTLCTVSKEGGPCSACRHANQGTADFAEGHLFCEADSKPRTRTSICTVRVFAKRDVAAEIEPYLLFEPFTGDNGTWGILRDRRTLANDASPAMRVALQADVAVIPADE